MHFERIASFQHGLHAERARAWASPAALSLVVASGAAGFGVDGQAAWLLVAAPWLEESVFRWGVQDGLEHAGLSSRVAALASALGFAVSHGLTRSWWLALAVLLPALWLALLYRHQRRLWPCVAWHAGFNAFWLWATAFAPAALPPALTAQMR